MAFVLFVNTLILSLVCKYRDENIMLKKVKESLVFHLACENYPFFLVNVDESSFLKR